MAFVSVTQQFNTTTSMGRLIHNILTDAKYIGKIVHKGQAYDAEHPDVSQPYEERERP